MEPYEVYKDMWRKELDEALAKGVQTLKALSEYLESDPKTTLSKWKAIRLESRLSDLVMMTIDQSYNPRRRPEYIRAIVLSVKEVNDFLEGTSDEQ